MSYTLTEDKTRVEYRQIKQVPRIGVFVAKFEVLHTNTIATRPQVGFYRLLGQ